MLMKYTGHVVLVVEIVLPEGCLPYNTGNSFAPNYNLNFIEIIVQVAC